MGDQKRKLIIIIVLILVLAVVVLLGLFALNKSSNEKLTPTAVQPDSLVKEVELKGILFFTGELLALRENYIEVIKDKEIIDPNSGRQKEFFEDMKKKKIDYTGNDFVSGEIRVFNISLKNPTTPVIKFLDGEKIEAKLSDLKAGQEVTVEYEEETNNAIIININQE